MAKPLHFYGEISRVDEEQRMVWGYAATTTRAEDQQEIAVAALEDALDEYMRFANIREMHQQVAVGVTREAHVDDKGMYIGAHVVDDAAWEKVKAGVYKGFSIKGPVTQRDPIKRSLITGLKIYEISLVDRPSDPDAVFDVWRAADAGAEPPDSNDAADAALEDDMSRAARKPEAQAAQPADAATETPTEVARTADGEAPAEDPAPAGGEVERAAEGEVAEDAPAAEGGGGEESEAGAAANASEDPVQRAVQAGADALQRAQEAIAIVQRSDEPASVIVLERAEVRRSLSLVSRLGYVLNELTYVIFDADFEKEIEGDDSSVPAQLREALRTLAVAYKAMSAEEVDELLAGLKVDTAVARGIYDLGIAGDMLERSPGDEISADMAGQLQTLFDGFVTRGWAPVLPEGHRDELQRQVDALTADRDTLLRSHDEVTGKVAELADQVKRMADTVAEPKTAGSLVRAVDKIEDAQGAAAAEAQGLSQDDIVRGLAAMPKDERDLLITRAALANPIQLTR